MNEIQINYICHVVIDYVYMCTNNAIISNIQSKDFIAVRCLHVTGRHLYSNLHAIFISLIIR